eukprot:4274963-Amphidinium_carterae.1
MLGSSLFPLHRCIRSVPSRHRLPLRMQEGEEEEAESPWRSAEEAGKGGWLCLSKLGRGTTKSSLLQSACEAEASEAGKMIADLMQVPHQVSPSSSKVQGRVPMPWAVGVPCG